MKLVIKDKNLEDFKKILKTGVKVSHEAELIFVEEGINIVMNSASVAAMRIVLKKEAFEVFEGEETIRVFLADVYNIIKNIKGELEINDDNDVINLIINGEKYTSPIVNESMDKVKYPEIDYEGQFIESSFGEFMEIVDKLDKIKTEEIVFKIKDKKLTLSGLTHNRTAEVPYKDFDVEDFFVRFPRSTIKPILNRDTDKVLFFIKENTPLQTICVLGNMSISYVCAPFNE